MLLHASYLINPNHKPISNAFVWIEGNTIRYAGSGAQLPSKALQDPKYVELNGSVISPGLVNSHSHLDLTYLASLTYPGSYVAWIRKVLAAQNSQPEEVRRSHLLDGIEMTLKGGTTAIGDHIGVHGEISTLLASPLRGRLFIEVLGVNPKVASDVFSIGLALIEKYRDLPSRLKLSLTPHSIHALDSEVLQKILAQSYDCFSIHLAESEAEQFYFKDRKGEMFDFIAERSGALPKSSSSAIEELQNIGALNQKILAVHGNYCSDAEITQLARVGASVVHCPFSHAYFSHQSFPLQNYREQRINIALGTDSLASATSLSMLSVLRRMLQSGLRKEECFSMATLGGAKALHMENEIGELAADKKADLIAFPLIDQDPLESLFQTDQVSHSMIGGDWVFYP